MVEPESKSFICLRLVFFLHSDNVVVVLDDDLSCGFVVDRVLHESLIHLLINLILHHLLHVFLNIWELFKNLLEYLSFES